MVKLGSLARVVRSKNAGPFTLTIDLIFDDLECYEKARILISREAVAAAYRVDPASVEVIPYPPARAVKVNIPRIIPSGHPGDRDVYGAQQHAPLLDLELELECGG